MGCLLKILIPIAINNTIIRLFLINTIFLVKISFFRVAGEVKKYYTWYNGDPRCAPRNLKLFEEFYQNLYLHSERFNPVMENSEKTLIISGENSIENLNFYFGKFVTKKPSEITPFSTTIFFRFGGFPSFLPWLRPSVQLSCCPANFKPVLDQLDILLRFYYIEVTQTSQITQISVISTAENENHCNKFH